MHLINWTVRTTKKQLQKDTQKKSVAVNKERSTTFVTLQTSLIVFDDLKC